MYFFQMFILGSMIIHLHRCHPASLLGTAFIAPVFASIICISCESDSMISGYIVDDFRSDLSLIRHRTQT